LAETDDARRITLVHEGRETILLKSKDLAFDKSAGNQAATPRLDKVGADEAKAVDDVVVDLESSSAAKKIHFQDMDMKTLSLVDKQMTNLIELQQEYLELRDSLHSSHEREDDESNAVISARESSFPLRPENLDNRSAADAVSPQYTHTPQLKPRL